MSRSTFILIVAVYGILQGLAQLFIPTFVSKNFGGDPTNNFELALWGFFGLINLSHSILFLYFRKCTDSQVIKSMLLIFSIVFFGLIALSVFNHFARNLPFNDSSPVDYTIWFLLGIGSLYYWNRSDK